MSDHRIHYEFFDLVAILHPKSGKIERVIETLLNMAAVMHANEPDTFKYKINREISGDAPHIVMTESFKDKAAYDFHVETQEFKDIMRLWEEEDLMSRPMDLLLTREVGGWLR